MKTFVASALMLGMFQQTLADDAPASKNIPPQPPPAALNPIFTPSPVFQIQRLISPGPVKRYVLTQPEPFAYPAPPQPVNRYLYSAQPPKRMEEVTQAELKNENSPGLTSFIHRAKHITAKKLARNLGRKFAMNHVINASHQKSKTNALLVIIPEEKTGSLIVTTASRNVDAIKRLIREIDRKPKQFHIEAAITIIADGKQIVMRPKITTTEGQPAIINIDSQGIQFELTIHNVRKLTQPQQNSPSVKKASAEKIYPQPMPATPTPASYRLNLRKPSSAEVFRALSASYQPIHQPRRKKEPHQHTESERVTEREKEIQHALEKQISLHFEDAWLIDVCKQIAKLANINLVIDNQGLKEEGLTSDPKVSIDVDGIRLKSALDILFKPLHLGYLIEDEVLKITSKSRAQGPQKTATYHVADLLAAPAPDHPAISFETLINLITSLVEPNSWSERGGQAVIRKYETTLFLVIRQTDAGHEKIKKLLDGLRDVQQDDFE